MTSASENFGSHAAFVSCWRIFRKTRLPRQVIEPIVHSCVDGAPSCETGEDETGSPYDEERLGPCLSSYAPADSCISRTSLDERGTIRSANQPPRPDLLISTLISVVRWPCYNYLPHRQVRLKRPLSGYGSKRPVPHEIDVGRLPVLQSPRGTRPCCRPSVISDDWSLPYV